MAASSLPDPATFEANIAALEALSPSAARELCSATPPSSVQLLAGRDGSPTYAWNDQQDRLNWLGRTSMPSVRAPALVDAFDPGSRNILLDGFGQGAEVRLLIQRLAPHQAVMALDENAWAVALSLRLYDLAADLRAGRLLLFAGPEAWVALRGFLLEHDGYLTPERVLAWPWFDPAAIGEVTDRLSAVNSEVARHRATKYAEQRRRPAAESERGRSRTIAIISNVPDAGVRGFAAQLEAAADSAGRPWVSFVLNDPAMVHPHAVEKALEEAAPSVLVLLDAVPEELQYQLPKAPVLIACTHGLPLASNWLERLPPTARLAVTTDAQRRQAVESGIDSPRLVLLPPAATTGLQASASPQGDGIVVVAQGGDASAQSAGLHLTSHRRLWKAATDILLERCDTYQDDQAESVIRDAERRLGIHLDSEEVRQGLVTRIRRILGPTLVRRGYLLALAEAGIGFDLFGGWAGDPILGKHDRGNWPKPPEVRSALAGAGLIISIETSGRLAPELLDGIAGGLAAFVRAHRLDDTPDGLSAVLQPGEHVRRFDQRRALVDLVRRFQARSTDFRERAAAGTRHVNSKHTWACRLDSIIQACGAE